MKYIVIDFQFKGTYRIVGFTNKSIEQFKEDNSSSYNFNNADLRLVELQEEAFAGFFLDETVLTNFISTIKQHQK